MTCLSLSPKIVFLLKTRASDGSITSSEKSRELRTMFVPTTAYPLGEGGTEVPRGLKPALQEDTPAALDSRGSRELDSSRAKAMGRRRLCVGAGLSGSVLRVRRRGQERGRRPRRSPTERF